MPLPDLLHRYDIPDDVKAAIRAHIDESDVVLLDLTMPRKSGEQVLAEISALRPGVPVILSSGFAEGEISQQFVEQPTGGFLQKPYRPSDLIGKVRQALRTGGETP